jgi:hypothetical protein
MMMLLAVALLLQALDGVFQSPRGACQTAHHSHAITPFHQPKTLEATEIMINSTSMATISPAAINQIGASKTNSS